MSTSKYTFWATLRLLHDSTKARGGEKFSAVFQHAQNDTVNILVLKHVEGISLGQLRYAVCQLIYSRLGIDFSNTAAANDPLVDNEDLAMIEVGKLADALSNPALTIRDKIELSENGTISGPITVDDLFTRLMSWAYWEDQTQQTSALVVYKFRVLAHQSPMVEAGIYTELALLFELYRSVHNEIWPENALSFDSPPVAFTQKLATPLGKFGIWFRDAAWKNLSMKDVLIFVSTCYLPCNVPEAAEDYFSEPPIPASTNVVYHKEPSWLNAVDRNTTAESWYFDLKGSKEMVVDKLGGPKQRQSEEDVEMNMADAGAEDRTDEEIKAQLENYSSDTLIM